jgi:predicted dehydrogenase
MGQVHASKYVQIPGVGLQAFDLDTEKLQSFVERFGARRAATLEDLLSQVDAVDVCLPTPAHVSVGVQCLDAGLPVLMEKPLARTVEEGRVLLQKVKETRGRLMPAQVVRYFPEFTRAHDIVASGELGDIASVRTRRGGGSPKSAWYADEAQSGGVLLDLAVHDFDWLLWTLGPAGTVDASHVRVARDASIGPAEHALTIIRFDSGAVAHVEATWMDPAGFRVTMDAAGSKGLLQFDSRDNPSLRLNLVSGPKVENNYAPVDDPYYRQVLAFVKSVESGDEFPVRPEEGLAAVAVAEAALRSAAAGTQVVVEKV